MTIRTIELSNGEMVDVEIDEPQPPDAIEDMIQLLMLAKHIRDNSHLFPAVWMPGKEPPARRKKKVE